MKWFPNSPILFSTVDYSGNVCLWDIRAKVPLSVRPSHEGKALCVDWLVNDELSAKPEHRVLSGGSDCALKYSLVESFDPLR